MTVSRFFHWKCGVCGRQALKTSYGLPDGWVVGSFGMDSDGSTYLEHFCPEHTKGGKTVFVPKGDELDIYDHFKKSHYVWWSKQDVLKELEALGLRGEES